MIETDVLLIQKEGVDLYETFVLSETSRRILRFYRPERLPYGVLISTSSLGGALSLLDEIRWYLRRYVREVIIGVGDGRYCTHSLAQEIYDRSASFSADWEYLAEYILSNGKLAGRHPLIAGENSELNENSRGSGEKLIVMTSEHEYMALFDDSGKSDPDILDVEDPLFSDPET